MGFHKGIAENLCIELKFSEGRVKTLPYSGVQGYDPSASSLARRNLL